MQLITSVATTPRYALIAEANRLLGPACLEFETEPCTAIYGFTNRDAYDRFRGDSPNSWRPYPLVSRHIERMLTQPGLQLVVLDACGPDEPSLVAGTAEGVLAAQANGAEQLSVAHYLLFLPEAHAYQVEQA